MKRLKELLWIVVSFILLSVANLFVFATLSGNTPVFVGAFQYVKLLVTDEFFKIALRNTVLKPLMYSVAFSMLVSLFCKYIITPKRAVVLLASFITGTLTAIGTCVFRGQIVFNSILALQIGIICLFVFWVIELVIEHVQMVTNKRRQKTGGHIHMGGSIKKFLLPAFAILYDVSTLVWCYVIASGLAYAVTFVSQTEMGIIGGADIPTFLFQAGNFLKLILSLLFVVLSIGTAVLLTLSACKKHISRKAAIVLCVLSAVSFIVFFFIPVDTYLVSLYTIVRNLSLVTCAHIVHIVLSGAVVLVNILSLKSTRANYEKPVKL